MTFRQPKLTNDAPPSFVLMKSAPSGRMEAHGCYSEPVNEIKVGMTLPSNALNPGNDWPFIIPLLILQEPWKGVILGLIARPFVL